MSKKKLDKFITEAIDNVRKDREVTHQLLSDIINYISKNGFENIFQYQSKYTFSKKKWAKHVFDLLDNITTHSKKNIWVEKTPLHLYYTDLITSADNNAVFIHVVREGKDNIASLFDASNKYPEYFRQQSLDSCINRYNKEIKISISRINQENHFFVKYENIIKNSPPGQELWSVTPDAFQIGNDPYFTFEVKSVTTNSIVKWIGILDITVVS